MRQKRKEGEKPQNTKKEKEEIREMDSKEREMGKTGKEGVG